MYNVPFTEHTMTYVTALSCICTSSYLQFPKLDAPLSISDDGQELLLLLFVLIQAGQIGTNCSYGLKLPHTSALIWPYRAQFGHTVMQDPKNQNAYQDFVIVLPGVVNNLPQYFEDFWFGEKCTESNSQITVNQPPV